MGDASIPIRGELLKDARRRRGWTQEELAARADCSERSVRTAEKGTAGLSVANRLADALGLTHEALTIEERLGLPLSFGMLPPRPALVVGRSGALTKLLRGFAADFSEPDCQIQAIVAVRGWPGVGKTTVAAELAYNQETRRLFPDGVLWAHVGQTPRTLDELRRWARALGDDAGGMLCDALELSRRLAAMLRDRRMLLIVDDAWRSSDARLFLIGGEGCGMLVTTRLLAVAEEITPSPAHRHQLDVLSTEESLELLRRLTPQSVVEAPDECRALVEELEGLPLAIQVAGRLLNAETRLGDRGLSVGRLLADVRGGARRLLAQAAPTDTAEVLHEMTPTVASLLRRSTDAMDLELQYRFAALGFYPPKPADFDVEGLAAMWDVPIDVSATTVADFLNRGLLEASADGRYQIHAVLIAHAKLLAEALP